MRITLPALLACTYSAAHGTPVDGTRGLARAVKKVGAILQTNAHIHGPKLAWSEVPIETYNGTFTAHPHKIAWSEQHKGQWIDWRKYKSNGVNLGAWLEQEKNFDLVWWNETIGEYADEWTWCDAVGKEVCGPKLEERYASFITTADIDKLGELGINTIRIATTYAAWYDVPGSFLYHGQQQRYIREIALHAIDKWHMHVILDLHSLPGGINSLEIGEAVGHNDWWYNVTNLDYSFRTVDAVLKFVQASHRPWAFTIAPGNEFNENVEFFARSAGLTENGTNWINTWIDGVLKRIARVDKRIPLMLQDSFQSERYWSPFYAADTNIVFDTHIYFFAPPNAYSQNVAPAVCRQTKDIATGDGKFPVFIGEWSLQSHYNNTLADRNTLYDTQIYAYSKYASGSAFWTYKAVNLESPVEGVEEERGLLQDYWSWEALAELGIVNADGVDGSFC